MTQKKDAVVLVQVRRTSIMGATEEPGASNAFDTKAAYTLTITNTCKGAGKCVMTSNIELALITKSLANFYTLISKHSILHLDVND